METISENGSGRNLSTPSLSMKKGANFSSSFKLRSPSLNSVRLRKIFDIFDRNNDGMITVDELSQALNLLGLEIDTSDLDELVKEYIKAGNSGLRFDDFEVLHRSLNNALFGLDDEVNSDKLNGTVDNEADALQDESDLSEAFKVFDEDGDGYISAKELQVVLAKLGLQEEGREIQRVEMMISSVDRNHDGRVDFFEFKDMMRSVLVRSA